MCDFMKMIQTRQSCRKYDSNRPVEQEKLAACVEAARIAPSACNAQPWKYLVVSGEKAQLVRSAVEYQGRNKFADDCPAFAVVLEEKAVLIPDIAAKFESQKFAQLDIGISVAHYCLAATELGLSTCIIGWMDETLLKQALKLPAEKTVRLVIATGYAAAEDTIRRKVRKPMDEMAEFIR